jgi:serine/threonine protein kinase
MVMKDYLILNDIGRGGMATVHLAHDQKFDTNVAIKVLNKEFVHNDNIRKRFLAEAKSMFKMSHPNIIKVNDLIEENDTVAFVMEYIEGETLKEYIDRKGKLQDDEIKTIFSQMLEAVGYVHKQNLVHRDIKPSNFMIDREGKVKLMDFGIAKTLDASSSEYTQTGTGAQMGTPMYMSPEQITETKSVTAQSDIYSLGVVLWQMVTGQKPYDTKTLSNFQLQMKIVQEELHQTNTGWDTIIRKATSKNSDTRFIDCSVFSQQVQFLEILGLADNSEETILINQAINSTHVAPDGINNPNNRFGYIGFFKWKDFQVKNDTFSLKITNGNEYKGDDGNFEESYRMRIELLERNVCEDFLVESTGTWELDRDYLIKTTKRIRVCPESCNEIVVKILRNLTESENKEAIWKVQEISSDQIIFTDLKNNDIQVIYRQDEILRRLIKQENESYKKDVVARISEEKSVLEAISEKEAFFGGHIDDLDEFVSATIACFEENYSGVNFNGELFRTKNKWPTLRNTQLNIFNLPDEIQKNIIVIGEYKICNGVPFLAERDIEVYLAAYNPRYTHESEGYVFEKRNSGELIRTNQRMVDANLLFIRMNNDIWTYSMSCWIDSHRDIPCIANMQAKGDILKIESYKQFSRDNHTSHIDEMRLNAKINKYIFNLWQNIDKRSII